ncbi:hypothetical protein AAGT15_23245 [Burkholderia pyrrocinia]
MVRIAAGTQRALERRLPVAIQRIDAGAVVEQHAGGLRIARVGRRVQRGADRCTVIVNVRAEFEQHVETAAAAAGAHVQRGVAVCVGRTHVRALRDEPAREIVGATVERQRRPFADPATRIHVAGVEHGLQLREVAFVEQRFEVLRQQFLFCFRHCRPPPSRRYGSLAFRNVTNR